MHQPLGSISSVAETWLHICNPSTLAEAGGLGVRRHSYIVDSISHSYMILSQKEKMTTLKTVSNKGLELPEGHQDSQ